MNFWKFFSDGAHRRNVVLVHMRDEKMLQLQIVFLDESEHRRGIPAGIEQRCFTRNFVPDQITIQSEKVPGKRYV